MRIDPTKSINENKKLAKKWQKQEVEKAKQLAEEKRKTAQYIIEASYIKFNPETRMFKRHENRNIE